MECFPRIIRQEGSVLSGRFLLQSNSLSLASHLELEDGSPHCCQNAGRYGNIRMQVAVGV
jgi:hypothetical protein